MVHGDGRPLSPHLQVYRWQYTMLASILHRFTGVALSVGLLLLAAWLIAAAIGPDAFGRVQHFLNSGLGLLMLFGWSLALFYHLCSGIRHLIWDVGVGLDLPSAEKGAYAVFAVSGGLTILAWVVGLAVW